jgi:hypothetical protein
MATVVMKGNSMVMASMKKSMQTFPSKAYTPNARHTVYMLVFVKLFKFCSVLRFLVLHAGHLGCKLEDAG